MRNDNSIKRALERLFQQGGVWEWSLLLLTGHTRTPSAERPAPEGGAKLAKLVPAHCLKASQPMTVLVIMVYDCAQQMGLDATILC